MDVVNFYKEVEALAKTQGLSEGIDFIELCKDRLTYREYMRAGIIACRSLGEYSAELAFVKEVFLAYPHDYHVLYSYVNTLFSLARLAEACDEIISWHESFKTMKFSDKSVKVLLDMGFYVQAANLWERAADSGAFPINKYDVKSRVEASKITHDSKKPETPFFCINLDQDRRKLSVVESVYANMGVDIRRVSGVLGSSLPASLVSMVDTRGKFLKERGTIGCALSHVKAWESALKNDYTLVLEDDGLPYYGFCQDVDDIASDFCKDILFVNERMSSLNGRGEAEGVSVSVYERLLGLPDHQRGWGGDGYIISKSGAVKLLEAFEADGICGHMDGQIGSYGVSIEDLCGSRALRTAFNFRKFFKSSLVADVSCLNYPFVQQVSFGYSSRKNVQ